EECERQAYQFYSTAQDLAASPPEPFPPAGSTPTEGAAAAAEGSQEAAGGGGGGDAAEGGGGGVEDGDDEARREAAECAREDWEEEVRQYREAGNQAQETAESVSAMITNILYYMATGSASCDLKAANAMARAIRKQAVEVRDGHALELLKAPFAVSLFRAYAENCAPVSGFLRCYPSSSSSADVAGVGGTDDLLALLALLAPAAIKAMDDNILNVHLSSLCNSLIDAVGDVIQKLDYLGRKASKAANGEGTREAAEGDGGVDGGVDGGADGGAREERERDERAVHAAIRIVKE
ncbi:unnamed protein product, partial [Ectocarpus sp. 12 AP-2014]